VLTGAKGEGVTVAEEGTGTGIGTVGIVVGALLDDSGALGGT